MSVCLILALCLTSVYCADWNTFQEETNTTITLLEERVKSLTDHTKKFNVTKHQKEAIDVVIHYVKDELVHLSDFEKRIKPELDKNHTLSQISFVNKTELDIHLIRDELDGLLNTLQDMVKTPTPPSPTTPVIESLTLSTAAAAVRAAEDKYLVISHEVSQYFLHKTIEVKKKIVSEIDAQLVTVKALIKKLESIKELLETRGNPEGSHVEKELFTLKNIEAGYSHQLGKISSS